MHRIRFYSDDSYQIFAKKTAHFVVAGVAICHDRADIRRLLLEAERVSRRGLKDWRATHSADERERYLDAVLDIPALNGRIFFSPFDALSPSDYWNARVDTLEAAIAVFTPGDCHHVMHPEGLQGNPRHQLRMELKKRGCERVTVDPAQFAMDPEVRLSDALAGYVRVEMYRGDGQRAVLTNIPAEFVNLEPKRRNPPGFPGG